MKMERAHASASNEPRTGVRASRAHVMLTGEGSASEGSVSEHEAEGDAGSAFSSTELRMRCSVRGEARERAVVAAAHASSRMYSTAAADGGGSDRALRGGGGVHMIASRTCGGRSSHEHGAYAGICVSAKGSGAEQGRSRQPQWHGRSRVGACSLCAGRARRQARSLSRARVQVHLHTHRRRLAEVVPLAAVELDTILLGGESLHHLAHTRIEDPMIIEREQRLVLRGAGDEAGRSRVQVHHDVRLRRTLQKLLPKGNHNPSCIRCEPCVLVLHLNLSHELTDTPIEYDTRASCGDAQRLHVRTKLRAQALLPNPCLFAYRS